MSALRLAAIACFFVGGDLLFIAADTAVGASFLPRWTWLFVALLCLPWFGLGVQVWRGRVR